MNQPDTGSTSGSTGPVDLTAHRVALIVACLTVFAPGLTSPFTHFDDNLYITANAAMKVEGLQGLMGLWSPERAFSGAFVEYFPLRDTLYWLLYRLWPAWPVPYHATSLVFHIAATLLTLSVLLRSGLPRSMVIGATWLFALHPVHVESVTWAAGLKDPMYTSLMLGSFWAYLKHREVKQHRWFGVSMALLVAALLCKSMAISLPLLLVAWEWLVARSTFRETLNRVWGFAVVSAAFLLQFIAIGAANGVIIPPHGGSWANHLVLASWAQVRYLKQVWLPSSFRLGYCFDPPTSLLDWRLLVAVLLAAVIIGTWRQGAHRSIRNFGLSWFFICLLPVANVMPFPALMADRYVYAASIGSGVVLMVLLEHLPVKLVKGVTVAIAVTFGLSTAMRSAMWQHEVDLWAEPDADAECMTDTSFIGVQVHYMFALQTPDRRLAMEAYDRALRSEGVTDSRTSVSELCIMMSARSELAREFADERQIKWAKAGAYLCRNEPRAWKNLRLASQHRDPKMAVWAATHESRLDPSPYTRVALAMNEFELTNDAQWLTRAEAEIASDPASSCFAVAEWGRDASREMVNSIDQMVQRCQAAAAEAQKTK